MVEKGYKPDLTFNNFNKEEQMTTENQTTTTPTPEDATFSRATSMVRSTLAKTAEKPTAGLKTLSLRPTRSLKKNDSFKPTRKLR
jgi:hypothetical protein